MHETRNFILVLVLIGAAIWAFVAWFVINPDASWIAGQRWVSLAAMACVGGFLFYAFNYEDKLPNLLKQEVGPVYYEADGLSFLPIVRLHQGRSELRVYYQNRYENPVQAIIHLRPPEESFVIRPGMRDVHFAFRADGGDFGVIIQPITIPEHLRGEVIDVKVAADTFYPRSHGARLRRDAGMPCGKILVDWQGAAFKTGVHEVSGEVEMSQPVILHMSMPTYMDESKPLEPEERVWKQERLCEGVTV